MPDPLFRQRLRTTHRDLRTLLHEFQPGSPERFDCERVLSALSRFYGTLYKESIEPVHEGPHPEGG